MNTPTPFNEQDRLIALYHYAILDTPPEAAFERLTQLVARLFNVPIVLVSLIDKDRQWFKSCFGLDVRQTDRKLSFCAHAILSDEVMVVEDAYEDDRFRDNDLVTGSPHIRFYAGAPLRTPTGFKLGTLCVIDTAPRQLTLAEAATLTDLAAMVVDEIELRQAAMELRALNRERQQAQTALEAAVLQNSQLVAAITNLTSGVVITDPRAPDNPIISANPAFSAMTGYSAEEVLGLNCRFLQGPDTDPAARDAMREAIAEQRPFKGELLNYRKDGTPFWNELAINPVFDLTGQCVSFVALQTDVTERKHADAALRESEERFRLLVANVQDYAIIQLDPEGRVVSWNRGAERITGYTAAEIIGQYVSRFHLPEDIAHGDAQEKLAVAAAHGRFEEENWRVRKDGSRFWASVVVTALFNDAGQVRGFAEVTRDITERKRIEEDLKEAKETAERANQAKSEFLSRMSHELRTPLNAVIGFSQLLELDDLAPLQRRNVELILRGGYHLLDLINEVLDIARIEAGRLELSMEPVAVHPLIRETLDLVRPLAAARNLHLRGPELTGPHTTSPCVWADHQRLKQVMLNLLGNAIKYNHEGGTVTLACEPATDGYWRLSVCDTGPGIPAEKLARLFVPFDRLGAEQTRIEGTGLGLALSQRLADAMGARLGVTSDVGTGSVFWVELPLAQAAAPPQVQLDELEETAAELNGPPSTLVYIEDNISNLELVERLLQRRPGIKVLTAMQGRFGLDLAREHQPDLILLDLHLPDISGYDVLLSLRAEPRLSGVPVVVLSADATPGQIERLLSSGASAYLTKPIDVKRFLQLIDELLHTSQSTTSIHA